MRKIFSNILENAFEENTQNILDLAEYNPSHTVVDLGCDDGSRTMPLIKKIGTNKVYGVEIIVERGKKAEKRGMKMKNFDLNSTFDLPSNYFDVVYSNQVIEHLADTDHFLSEIMRILKNGGYVLLSTEKLASWHNVIALFMGYQPFSMTNFSRFGSIGNPLAIWRNKKNTKSNYSSWLHNRLFTARALTELVELHGLKMEKMMTAGYYPLPNIFAKLDPNHGHWLVIKARKP